MTGRAIHLDPVDVLFFRDARPFGAGSESHASIVFPPLPSVTAGALRTAAMVRHGADFARRDGLTAKAAEVWGRPGQAEFKARICGPFLSRNGSALFPMPADLEGGKESESAGPAGWRWAPARKARFECGLPSGLRPLARVSCAGLPVGQYLDRQEMARYLLNREPEIALKGESLYDVEIRSGIALDRSRRTALQGHLYGMSVVRMRPHCGLVLSVDGDEDAPLPESGVLRLGGEARMARYTAAPGAPWPQGAMQGDRFKWVVVTPALFGDNARSSWLPAGTDGDLIYRSDTVQARLVAARIPRMIPAGGFDVADNRHKELRLAVPAGAVFFFERIAGDPVKAFHGRSVSDFAANQGFGIALVGGWDYV